MIPHAILWIDHHEARLLTLSADAAHATGGTVVKQHSHIHSKSHVDGHRKEDRHYLDEVLSAVREVEELLVVGPSSAKDELVKYLQTHDATVAARVVGTETVDHPSDGQLIAHAEKYFAHYRRMH